MRGRLRGAGLGFVVFSRVRASSEQATHPATTGPSTSFRSWRLREQSTRRPPPYNWVFVFELHGGSEFVLGHSWHFFFNRSFKRNKRNKRTKRRSYGGVLRGLQSGHSLRRVQVLHATCCSPAAIGLDRAYRSSQVPLPHLSALSNLLGKALIFERNHRRSSSPWHHHLTERVACPPNPSGSIREACRKRSHRSKEKICSRASLC